MQFGEGHAVIGPEQMGGDLRRPRIDLARRQQGPNQLQIGSGQGLGFGRQRRLQKAADAGIGLPGLARLLAIEPVAAKAGMGVDDAKRRLLRFR